MRAGDPVIYLPDPLLYGEMEFHFRRKDKRVVCKIDPDGERPTFEVFDAAEIEVPKAVAA